MKALQSIQPLLSPCINSTGVKNWCQLCTNFIQLFRISVNENVSELRYSLIYSKTVLLSWISNERTIQSSPCPDHDKLSQYFLSSCSIKIMAGYMVTLSSMVRSLLRVLLLSIRLSGFDAATAFLLGEFTSSVMVSANVSTRIISGFHQARLIQL